MLNVLNFEEGFPAQDYYDLYTGADKDSHTGNIY